MGSVKKHWFDISFYGAISLFLIFWGVAVFKSATTVEAMPEVRYAITTPVCENGGWLTISGSCEVAPPKKPRLHVKKTPAPHLAMPDLPEISGDAGATDASTDSGDSLLDIDMKDAQAQKFLDSILEYLEAQTEREGDWSLFDGDRKELADKIKTLETMHVTDPKYPELFDQVESDMDNLILKEGNDAI